MHTLTVYNPATGAAVAEVPDLGSEATRDAIAQAEIAQRSWRQATGFERAVPLTRMAALMREQTERLAQIMTSEQGKPLKEARGEIGYAATFLDSAAAEATRIRGELVPGTARNQRIMVMRQPIGVTAAITPWNFPSAMITRKLGPALAAGCAMVVKPAEQTPLSALALAELATQAGLPAGLFTVITTSKPAPVASEMLRNPAVRMLTFTGSTPVGQILMAQAAQNVTRLGLELGGHAPFIVFDDADLDAAVPAAIACKFRNAGQTCIRANRFLVQDGIADAFIERFVAATAKLTVGVGTDEGVDVGPLIDDDAMAKVEQHVADAIARGAVLRTGGHRVAVAGAADRFYAPTVLEGVDAKMRCCSEETFGPVAPIRRFTTEEEAIAIANDTPFGLAAYFFTRDGSRIMRVAEALEYGIIGANDGAPSSAQAPFGGVKQSGLGREGGHWVMDEYVEIKYVSWRI